MGIIENKDEDENNGMDVMKLNDEDYYILDADQIFQVMFSQDNTTHFLLYQKTLELAGIVKDAEMRENVIKFSLYTKKDKTILQVLIWEKEIIERVQKFIVPGNILHLDGLIVKVKFPSCSISTVPFDLNVSTNTKVHVLTQAPRHVMLEEHCNELTSTTIEESVNYNCNIEIVAWIKQKIAAESLPKDNKINQGCLSDCHRFKLEIRMSILCDMSEFPVGTHVKVNGKIQHGKYPFLSVLKKEDVMIQSSDVKSLGQLLKGYRIPTVTKADNNNVQDSKKFCSGTLRM